MSDDQQPTTWPEAVQILGVALISAVLIGFIVWVVVTA